MLADLRGLAAIVSGSSPFIWRRDHAVGPDLVLRRVRDCRRRPGAVRCDWQHVFASMLERLHSHVAQGQCNL